jgi:hypothetical protein
MANNPQSRLQRNYAQIESAYGVVNNTSGASTVAAGDAFLCESLDMNQDQPENQRPDKTGVLGLLAGTPGRKNSNWTMRCSLAGSGSAGTPPDIDQFLQAAMGAAGVVVSSTSVTYGRGESNTYGLTLFDFNSLATGTQRLLAGCVVNRMRLDFGGNFATADFSGVGRSMMTSNGFSGLDTASKCSLTAFPSEPGTRTTAGSPAAGYKGTVTLDGNVYTSLRTGYVEVAWGRELPGDTWNSDLPGTPSEGLVAVNVGLNMYDDDSSNFATLKAKAENKTALVNLSFVIGTIAGNIITMTVSNVRLNTPRYDYSQTRRVVDFGTSPAHISSSSAVDDLVVAWT